MPREPHAGTEGSRVRAEVVPLVPAWRVDGTFHYAVPTELAARVAPGALVRIPFGARRVRGIVVGVDTNETEGLEWVAAMVTEGPVAPPPHDLLLRWLARRYVVPLGRAFERAVPPRVRVRATGVETVGRGPRPSRLPARPGGAELLAAIEGDGSGVWCLRCLPGEERVALIAELVGACARAGGQALVAVPEVRFGSPTIDALAGRWPGLARLDSAVPDKHRSHDWLRMAAGHGLGAGGRGAVLAPAPRLRAIVVDEEDHFSYKEDRAPRYDARKVARERARLQGAVCVLVSATPKVESIYGVGAIEPERAEERAARPLVETFEPRTDYVLSRPLHARIHDALGRGDRVAVLVPARGYARALWCSACARSLRCPVCEAGLFYDSETAERLPSVRCARCELVAPAPEKCPDCGASEWRYVGAGSERFAEQLDKAFPRASITRMDPSVAAPAELGASADIYVTTWFGTKPALRPDVSLVAVVDADSLLRRPDWRAAESCYRALAAMAEWVGPAETGGRLAVQTAEPSHYAIQAVVRGDYRFFYDRELAVRRELRYPPFVELLRATAFGPRRSGLVERVAGAARTRGGTVLGPISVDVPTEPGVVEPGAEVLIKCDEAEPLCDDLRGILASVPAGSRLRIDVDPR